MRTNMKLKVNIFMEIAQIIYNIHKNKLTIIMF